MFKFLILTIVASACLYLLGMALAKSAEPLCKGWKCEEVYCPDNYAVRLPDGSYLPCEKFDEYQAGNKKVVVK